jgi:hypothetical protein
MGMKLPAQLIVRATGPQARKQIAPSTPAVPRGMNRWEQLYSDHLRDRRIAGEVRWFGFEIIRLRLAMSQTEKEAWYKPDFMVVMADGSVELHEVKGHWREAARLRVKIASEIFPFPLIVVTRSGSQWQYERM